MSGHKKSGVHRENHVPPFHAGDVKPLSEALQKTFIVGGNALVAMLAFLVLVFVAFFLAESGQSEAGYVAFALAAAILAFLGVGFVYKVLLPAHQMRAALKVNEEMLDTVQNSALQLTDIVQQLNNYALLNSNQIVDAVALARVWLAGNAFADRLLALPAFSRTVNLADQIRRLSDECHDTMTDIATSIRTADPTKMKQHFTRLQALQGRIRTELFNPAVNEIASAAVPALARLEDATEQTAAMLASMRTMSLMLVDSLEKFSALSSKSASTTLEAIADAKGILQFVPGAKNLMNGGPMKSVEAIGRRVIETSDETLAIVQNIRESLAKPTREGILSIMQRLSKLQQILLPVPDATERR